MLKLTYAHQKTTLRERKLAKAGEEKIAICIPGCIG